MDYAFKKTEMKKFQEVWFSWVFMAAVWVLYGADDGGFMFAYPTWFFTNRRNSVESKGGGGGRSGDRRV